MTGRAVQDSNKISCIIPISLQTDKRTKAQVIFLQQFSNVLLRYINDWQKFYLKLVDPICSTPALINIWLGSDLIPQIIPKGISNTLRTQNTFVLILPKWTS